ncbi:MAG: hypothetical protein KDK25_14200 [Leptospiraceae bacterium]|nr:hypothetical protein [Leptospiraceae bacterium]
MDWKALEKRNAEIMRLADYLRAARQEGHTPRLLFVCTHNSRRSQLARAVAPLLYHRICLQLGIDKLPFLQAHSGGSETTLVHPNTVRALLRSGFRLEKGNPAIPVSDSKEGAEMDHAGDELELERFYRAKENPIIPLRDPEGHFLELFSKLLDHPANPGSGFAAIMVCSSADEACPLVKGADVRISLPFPDPGQNDDTPAAPAAYDGTLESISRDLCAAFLLALRPA